MTELIHHVLIQIGIVALGTFIGYVFEQKFTVIIIIVETLTILWLYFSSYKKFRSMYLFRKFGPHHGYKLLQAHNSNKVYLIVSGCKRWIKEPATLNELGYDVDMIEYVDREVLNQYPEKSALSIHWFSEIG